MYTNWKMGKYFTFLWNFLMKKPTLSLKITKSVGMGDFGFEKKSATQKLDTCFNNMEIFYETMQYGYDDMIAFCSVHVNKVKFKK